MDRLLDALRDENVHFEQYKGWQERGGKANFVGQVNHHTASPYSNLPAKVVHWCLSGAPAAPLCNGLGDRHGTLHLLAAGATNHCGRGTRTVLERVVNDRPPLGDAREFGLADDFVGNAYYLGWEWEHPGIGGAPWPEPLLDLAVRVNVACCRLFGWTANRSIYHREHTARKPDPRWTFDLRKAVATRLDQGDDDIPLTDHDLHRIAEKVKLELLGDIQDSIKAVVEGNVDRIADAVVAKLHPEVL